jgi:hypothetical protein
MRQKLDAVQQLINKALEKVFELSIDHKMLSEIVYEKLSLLRGVDTSRIKFSLDAEKNIYFGNTYTALLYMGFWNDALECFSEGTLVTSPDGDLFTMTNGTRVSVSADGDILVMPVCPIEYIKLDIVITKDGIRRD